MRVQVGDVRLFFDVEGSKLRPDGPRMREVPTLLLLHGGPGSDHSPHKPAFSVLTDVVQVIYLDHRGAGRSDRSSPDRWNLAQWADDVKAFCDVLEIQRPIVLGVSFGGFVAMTYATRYPDHPGKLILNSTKGRRGGVSRMLAACRRLGGAPAEQALRAQIENPCPETVAEFQRVCGPLGHRQPMDPDRMARQIRNMELWAHFLGGEINQFDLLPDLDRVKCPTLVLGAEDDVATPIGDSEDIAAALPAHLVRFERFANAGHAIFFDEPERFFAVLREFILE
jgi:pimeloyl-ACP methyl ester carboxylesterase